MDQMKAVSLIGIGCLLLCMIIVGVEITIGDFDDSTLFRDPNAIAGQPFYFGIISTAGVILWTSAAAICLFTGWIARTQHAPAYPFFLSGGLLSALLCLDDAYMLHEDAGLMIGISERSFLLFEAFMFVFFLAYNARFILGSAWLSLLAACGCFGISVLMDLTDLQFSGATTMEDALKFCGIVFWTFYFTQNGCRFLRQNEL